MSLPQALLDTYDSHVVSHEPLHGGDLSEVALVTLGNGDRLVAKRGPLVDAEGRMLSAMRMLYAPVPEVIHVEHGLLCMEYLEEATPGPRRWREFGTALARMHSWAGQGYGWNEDYAFGSLRIENETLPTWPEFWAERRLLPFLPNLPAELGQRIEALAARVGERLPRDPNPALLHGDLWTGNLLFTKDQAVMIDPACYYGHSEVDLAMLTLFGEPDTAFWRGYGKLEPGYSEREAIYKLWPALVHMTLFGDTYRPMVERFLADAEM